jgi:hypothetical protein
MCLALTPHHDRCSKFTSTRVIRSDPSISTISEFYNAVVKPLGPKPGSRTFYFWIATGVRFLLLAGGGSIYALILIAAKDLRWSITIARAEVSWQVAKMLRRPDTCSMYELCSIFNYASDY